MMCTGISSSDCPKLTQISPFYSYPEFIVLGAEYFLEKIQEKYETK